MHISKRVGILCGLSILLSSSFAGVPAPKQEGTRTPLIPPQEPKKLRFVTEEEAVQMLEEAFEHPDQMAIRKMSPEELNNSFRESLKQLALFAKEHPELFPKKQVETSKNRARLNAPGKRGQIHPGLVSPRSLRGSQEQPKVRALMPQRLKKPKDSNPK